MMELARRNGCARARCARTPKRGKGGTPADDDVGIEQPTDETRTQASRTSTCGVALFENPGVHRWGGQAAGALPRYPATFGSVNVVATPLLLSTGCRRTLFRLPTCGHIPTEMVLAHRRVHFMHRVLRSPQHCAAGGTLLHVLFRDANRSAALALWCKLLPRAEQSDNYRSVPEAAGAARLRQLTALVVPHDPEIGRRLLEGRASSSVKRESATARRTSARLRFELTRGSVDIGFHRGADRARIWRG